MLTLISLAEARFREERTLVEVPAPCKIFGDIHGQFRDLRRLFNAFGAPTEKNGGDIGVYSYVFLGDFVDRGPHGLEVIALLLALKVRWPDRVFLLRGNHEDAVINEKYGFRRECAARMPTETEGDAVWTRLNAALVEGSILCVHAGPGKITWLDEIRSIRRPLRWARSMTNPSRDQQALCDLVWSDPASHDDALAGHSGNAKRGCSTVFGPDVVREFCGRNGLQVIVRGHEEAKRGYEFFAGGHGVTVFSAMDYCGKGNDAAILRVSFAAATGGKTELQVQPEALLWDRSNRRRWAPECAPPEEDTPP